MSNPHFSETTVRRLTRMIEVMQEIQAKRRAFDIDYWGIAEQSQGLSLLMESIRPYQNIDAGDRELEELNHCGTTCCAVGHAVFDPQLRAEGLRVQIYKNFSGQIAMEPMFGGELGLEAVESFFDVHEKVSERLFGGEYAIAREEQRSTTPADVIAAIQYTLEHGHAPEWSHIE